MESFKEQTCDFSMSYGMTPDVCTSIVFNENHRSKRQLNLELKRMHCARKAANKSKYCLKQCIPKEKLMTHEAWLEHEKIKESQPMTEEERLACAKRMQELTAKHKKCPFMSKLGTVLERSDEHRPDEEGRRSGFEQLMVRYIHAFADEEDGEGESEDGEEGCCGGHVRKEEEGYCGGHVRKEEGEGEEEQGCCGQGSGEDAAGDKICLRKLSEEFEHIHIPSDPTTATTSDTCPALHHGTHPTQAASGSNPHPQGPKKTARGWKKLWKRFHAICEQSTPNPITDAVPALHYSPGATPSDMPLFM